MRVVQARNGTRRMAGFCTAAVQGNKLPQAGSAELATKSKVGCERSVLTGQEAVPSKKLQEILWKQFFADNSQWWDNRWNKPTSRHPDFIHKTSKVPLWLSNWHKPDWVDSNLATLDAGLKTTLESHLQVGKCINLCEGGVLSDTVNNLDQLVQRGSHVPKYLFYSVLKRCIQVKDLAQGRRIHALTVKSGYDGDEFLATHLMNMYAVHVKLEEAMAVFTNVLAPSISNWTTIISAYARHGDAAEAIWLYRKMWDLTTVEPDNRLYPAVLKACAAAKDIVAGREVHAHILASSGQIDRFIQAGLVNMYAKCGCLEDARSVFDQRSDRNIVAWTTMIAAYVRHKMGEEALNLYSSMLQGGIVPDSVTYVCLLQACASVGVGALCRGKQLHAEIALRGLGEDATVGGSLVNMYAKCGSLVDARKILDKLPKRSIVAWTAMVAGYAQQGLGQEALRLYSNMRQEGLSPDSVTYVCLLQACTSVGAGALHEGRQLHVQVKERGLEDDAGVGGSLVNMYAKCGSLQCARKLFDKLSHKNLIAWTAMIAGYVQKGMGKEALSLYNAMRQDGMTPNSVTFLCLLQACAIVGVGAAHEGKQLHGQVEEHGLGKDEDLCASLVNMYVKCGCLEDASTLFSKLPYRSIVAWNAMLAGYVQYGKGQKALSLYNTMDKESIVPDSVTYVCLLQACASVGVGALQEGKKLHVRIEELGLEEDLVLGSSLVNMYAKCGSLDLAHGLFEKLPDRSVVAWNALIAGYAQQGMGQEALKLSSSMQREGVKPNSATYVCLLQACASLGIGALCEGKQLHAQVKEQGLEADAVVGGSLINMYFKCGNLTNACEVFDKLLDKSIVAWTAMIAGYAQQGMGQEALSLYSCLQQEGLTPDSVTYVCLLQACAAAGALPLGEHLHAEIKARGMQDDGNVEAALINMYAKCGNIGASQRVFDALSQRSVDAYNALVSGYAHQGDSQSVFDLLIRMELETVHPDEVTFLSILTVCSHVGLVDEGRKYFEVMRSNHGISATLEHYMCMIDLLGRAGHLHEALKVAKSMPFPANGAVWLTLLGACRKWKNVEIGQQAFKGVVSVDEKDASAYVLMSNIYESAQMWEASKEMKARRIDVGAWKEPGQSWWTDMGGVLHTFSVGGKRNPQIEIDPDNEEGKAPA